MKKYSDDRALIRIYSVALAMLVIAIALVSSIAYWHLSDESEPMRISQPQDVDRIRIIAQSRPPITLKKTDQNWYINEPFVSRASNGRVDAIVSAMGGAVEHFFDSSNLDLVQLDLDPARIELQLNDVQFFIGGSDQLTGYHYVMHEDKVHLLAAGSGFSLLDKDVYALCENRLSQYASDITAVQLGQFLLAQDAENKWQWQKKDDVLGLAQYRHLRIEDLADDQTQLSQWIDKWKNAYALYAQGGYINDDVTPVDERVPVVIGLSNQKTVHYQLVQTNDETIFYTPDNDISHRYSTETQKALLNLPLRDVEDDASATPPASSGP